MRHRVTVTRRLPAAVEQRLTARFDVTRNTSDAPLGAAGLIAALRDSDAIVSTLGDPISADVLRAGAGRTKLIAHFGVGFDNIDIAAASELGIRVTNTPGVLTDDTADLTMLLLLAAARRASEGVRELADGSWSGWRPTHLLGTRLSGKALGLVGFGRIARAVAQRARSGFGMRVRSWSRSLTDAQAIEAGVERCETLDALLQSSDFVSLHIPRTADTRHVIDARRIALLQPHAYLVNTARGDIVDEGALITALAERRFGLDVFEHEPRVPPDLLALPSVFALPHLGSATVETRTAMGMLAASNLEAFFDGAALPNPVN
jgi:lactate dehydrogenase-like 2-hydroxyacid dehydrogenase